jgi:hypothetical protein
MNEIDLRARLDSALKERDEYRMMLWEQRRANEKQVGDLQARIKSLEEKA